MLRISFTKCYFQVTVENKFEGIKNECGVAVPVAKVRDDLMVV